MFEDAGKKIKKVAKGYFITMTIIGILTGIVLFAISFDSRNEEAWGVSGLLTMFITPFVAWLSSLILYGFGEIVDTAIVNRKEEISVANTKRKTISNAVVNTHEKKKSVFKTIAQDNFEDEFENDDSLVCPICEWDLTEEDGRFYCAECKKQFILKKVGIVRYLKEDKN